MPGFFDRIGFPEMADPRFPITGPIDGAAKALVMIQAITMPITLASVPGSNAEAYEISQFVNNIHLSAAFFGFCYGLLKTCLQTKNTPEENHQIVQVRY